MGLGGVKRRRRGKLVEQLSFRIAMRATTVFERGRFRVILRKHFSRFWSLGGFQNGRAVRQNERNRLLDRPAMSPFCGVLTRQHARLVAARRVRSDFGGRWRRGDRLRSTPGRQPTLAVVTAVLGLAAALSCSQRVSGAEKKGEWRTHRISGHLLHGRPQRRPVRHHDCRQIYQRPYSFRDMLARLADHDPAPGDGQPIPPARVAV